MKKLILFLSLIISTKAFALPIPYVELKEGDRALYPMVGEYSVDYMVPACEEGEICLPTTVLVINYTLGGCLDRAFAFDKVDFDTNGNIDVYVTAMNISNKDSIAAICTAMPTYTQEITLGGGMISEESINVHFLGIPENGLE